MYVNPKKKPEEEVIDSKSTPFPNFLIINISCIVRSDGVFATVFATVFAALYE